MEELLAYLFLRLVGIVTEEEYQNRLDAAFLADEGNVILLELELNGDIWHAIAVIERQIDWNAVDREIFGKKLTLLLENHYNVCPDKKRFGEQTYSLWGVLPWAVSGEDPFRMLSYAGDPLSYGDEKQSEGIYREIFDFYKEKDGS